MDNVFRLDYYVKWQVLIEIKLNSTNRFFSRLVVVKIVFEKTGWPFKRGYN